MQHMDKEGEAGVQLEAWFLEGPLQTLQEASHALAQLSNMHLMVRSLDVSRQQLCPAMGCVTTQKPQRDALWVLRAHKAAAGKCPCRDLQDFLVGWGCCVGLMFSSHH